MGMITAPSYRVLESATIPTYEEYFTRDFLSQVNKTDGTAETKNGCKLWFRTTKDPYLLRGPTLGFFHMDEGADSPAMSFKVLQARLRQTGMPNQGWVTSTPMGFNWLYAEFEANERDNYQVIKARSQDNFFLPDDYVDKLRESYTDEQFLLQELEGEFIEVGGHCPFDMKALNEMYQDAKERDPVSIERNFIMTYINNQVGKRYVIGADAATGVGKDESAFVIGSATPSSITVVCCGKQKMPEVEFADLLDKKGRYYNNGTLVVEAAPVGKATLNKLEELHYPRLYKEKDKVGFQTTRLTKGPMLVADLAEAIKDRVLNIYDFEIIEQLMSYIRTEKGTYEATSGARDDYVSALMMLIQGVKAAPSYGSPPRIVITR